MSSPRRVRVIGAGGHAKVVLATLRAAGYDVDGIFDDDPSKLGEAVLGVSVLGTVSDAVRGDPLPVVIALGDNSTRKRVADQLTDQLMDLRKEQFNLRFQKASGQLENTARVRQVRRNIARIKSVLNRIQANAKVSA